MSNNIHPSAIVSATAKLGSSNQLGPFVVIEDNVELGDNNVLHAGAVLKQGTRLGNDNVVHEYTVLGGLPQDINFDPATPSYVLAGNGNVFHEYVTVHRGSKPEAVTRLGDNNFLMTHVHIGHDCQLGNHVIIAPSTGLGGHVHVEDRAFISGGVMVHQFVNIGSFAMLGGNAKITQDVLPFMTIDGNPARVCGLNKVGLRRGGFSQEDMKIIKHAYQTLFFGEENLENRLQQLAAVNHPATRHLLEFIQHSKRGFHRDKS